MLIDLHAHTSGISKCCQISAPEVVKRAHDIGLGGIVLTNHYQKSYIENGDVRSFAQQYIEEYYYTKKCGEKIGCKVFWGIEVTMEQYPNVHLLIYGVDTEFVMKYPLLFDYTQEELYSIVKQNGGILIQAHPFRNGAHVLDTDFLDGVEINCHPLYGNSYSTELLEIACKNGLLVTCGGDFHADTYRPYCGTYLPDEVYKSYEIGKYLCSTNEIRLCIQEPNELNYEDCLFVKSEEM